MPITRPDISMLTTKEKRDLINQIEDSMVPGAPDNLEKVELVGEIWSSIDPKEFTISDDMLAELERLREEYRRDPTVAKSWEEAKAWILNRNARTQNSANGRG